METAGSPGFSMPAEWEHHEATWIGWPHNKSDWPGKFTPIPWVYGEIVRWLSSGEIIRIIVGSRDHEKSARIVLKRVGVDLSKVEFFHFATDRGWTRDFGPMFVRNAQSHQVAINNFKFTGWAKYDNWKKDCKVHRLAAKALELQLLQPLIEGMPFVLEGGAIDVNGKGTLLTTEECLLDQAIQVRNPGMTRETVERALKDSLGVTNVLWLGKGIAGDDTHGHVDDVARFVDARTVLICEERNSSDSNYKLLQENRERLEGMKLENGSKPEIVKIPMPEPLVFDEVRVPASYANFYVGNAAVVVPTFNDPKDRIALGILSELFADRPVVGIHAVDLVWGFGTLHCLTQQQPAG